MLCQPFYVQIEVLLEQQGWRGNGCDVVSDLCERLNSSFDFQRKEKVLNDPSRSQADDIVFVATGKNAYFWPVYTLNQFAIASKNCSLLFSLIITFPPRLNLNRCVNFDDQTCWEYINWSSPFLHPLNLFVCSFKLNFRVKHYSYELLIY